MNNPLDRRTFLQLTAGAIAVKGGECLFARTRKPGSTVRGAAVHPVTLRSPQLEVLLDRERGLPHEFHLLGAHARIWGAQTGETMAATICRKGSGRYFEYSLRSTTVKTSPSQADFFFNMRVNRTPAASFVLRYRLAAGTVHVSLEDVREGAGYELIEVAIPSLATVREEDGGGWLAHGEDGGNLAMLSEAKTGALPPNRFWGKVMATLPVVMIGNARAICVQEVTSFMDGTELSVAGEPGTRRATLGTVKAHRVNGSLSWDMNTGPNTPRISGNARTPNLLVGQRSACRLDFLPAPGESGADWLAGAKLVRDRMPPIPTHYYDDKLVYGIRCDEPSFKQPAATFEQCRQLIADVAALTDRAPQVVHLWGWQYKGKDTGYPAVAEVNQRIGGYEGMMRLMEEARALNCTVTLSDNYDDAYRSSPEWDEKIIARRPDGELWKSRNWTGEDSYIIGLAKYLAGPGRERVRYTCERYKLRETTHIDVLSYYPIRNDWDPEQPASGIKNLQARYAVLEEFARRGIDVSSEALRYAFIGKVSSVWALSAPRPCPFGGQPIPLLPLIYRKSVVWGQSGRGSQVDRLLTMLFYNACAHMIVSANMERTAITDHFYLMMVPWFQLHGRNIESFYREGERTRISLEGDAIIDIDWGSKTYAVKIAGAEITRNDTTTCPLDDGRLAFYSATEREVSAPVPGGWDANRIVALTLSTRSTEELPVRVEGGRIKARVPSQRGVIVYRDRDRARQRVSS